MLIPDRFIEFRIRRLRVFRIGLIHSAFSGAIASASAALTVGLNTIAVAGSARCAVAVAVRAGAVPAVAVAVRAGAVPAVAFAGSTIYAIAFAAGTSITAVVYCRAAVIPITIPGICVLVILDRSADSIGHAIDCLASGVCCTSDKKSGRQCQTKNQENNVLFHEYQLLSSLIIQEKCDEKVIA